MSPVEDHYFFLEYSVCAYVFRFVDCIVNLRIDITFPLLVNSNTIAELDELLPNFVL